MFGQINQALTKGFGDRAKSLCDKDTSQHELQNLKEIFMEIGYDKEKIQEYISEKQSRIEKEKNEGKLYR